MCETPKNPADFRRLYNEYLARLGSPDAQADKALWAKALEYEAFFDDMRFKPGSIVEKFIFYQMQNVDHKEQILDCYAEVPVGLLDDHIRFYVAPLEGTTKGTYDHEERTVTIIPESAGDPVILLHEMIHIFENLLGEFHEFVPEILIFCLLREMGKKVPDLDERIEQHAHLVHGGIVAKQAGSHGILFYLKSLDLDLRMGFKLGTVCGYNRDRFV